MSGGVSLAGAGEGRAGARRGMGAAPSRARRARRFRTLAEFDRALHEAIAGPQMDLFWERVVALRQMPLVFGERTAVFFYRGPARTVAASGDFRLPYVRQGDTDLWVARRQFEADARVEYRLRLDSRRWILDPLNSLTETGGLGAKSVLRMPGYPLPAAAARRAGIAHGTLSENVTLASRSLGYDVNVRVYTPAGRHTADRLPSVYVADGQDYAHEGMGALVNVLDNLIADGRIRPLLAVFIDPRDPLSGVNRREEEFVRERLHACPLCDFVATELVPFVDAAYPTHPSRDARVMLGFSYGGMFTAHMGLAYPDVFGGLAIQSPYITRRWLLDMYRQVERLPLKVFLSHGTYDAGASSLRLRRILEAKAYPLRYVETHEGHSFGAVRGLLAGLLEYFFRPA